MDAMDNKMMAFFDDQGSILGASSLGAKAEQEWRAFGGSATTPAYKLALPVPRIHQIVANGEKVKPPVPALR